MKPYPDSRVVGGFTLAPMVGGILMFLYFVFPLIFDNLGEALDNLDKILVGLVLLCISGFIGLIIFGIPAFLFGCVYAYLKLERTPSAFIIITLISFIGTALYVAMLFCLFSSENSFTESLPAILAASGLATLSSWIVAWRVLPKRGELSQE